MNRIELFKRTIDVLYKAHKDGHLQHVSSCGCAVGNLVCNALEPEKFKNIAESDFIDEYSFAQLFKRPYKGWWAQIHQHRYGCAPPRTGAMDFVYGREEVRETGYSLEELSAIEFAFETADVMTQDMDMDEKREIDPTGVKGLMGVIDRLGEIHEAPDVAVCLKEAIVNGTYTFESDEFKEFLNRQE